MIIIAWPSPPASQRKETNNNKFRRDNIKKTKESMRLDTRVASPRGQTDSKIEQAIVCFHVLKDAAMTALVTIKKESIRDTERGRENVFVSLSIYQTQRQACRS